jgi:hypothetical protein
MFEHMTKGSWTISTSTYDDCYQDIHEDKVNPVINALNDAKRDYWVINKNKNDTWTTIITLT